MPDEKLGPPLEANSTCHKRAPGPSSALQLAMWTALTSDRYKVTNRICKIFSFSASSLPNMCCARNLLTSADGGAQSNPQNKATAARIGFGFRILYSSVMFLMNPKDQYLSTFSPIFPRLFKASNRETWSLRASCTRSKN